jgi:predicted Zn-dependent peptidase
LFKGTEARGARALAEAVDAVGGDLNAYTAHEHTAFHARLPADELDLGLDVLSEVVWGPALRTEDVEAERAVILEELAMEEDTPDDRVLTLLAEALFPDHPLGREVLGTRTSIGAIGRDDVVAFHGRWYRPANVVVAAAGALDHASVVAGVRARLGEASGGELPLRVAPSDGPRPRAVLRRRAEQAHVALGLRALPREDEDRFALAVANQILGGGTASRLFQSVREERGLAYSVHSWVDAHADTGALVAYAGTAVEHLGEVLGLLEEAVRGLAEGVTDREVAVAAGYLAGSTVLALEDPGSRMARIGESLLATGGVPAVDDVLAGFRSVTAGDVARVGHRLLAGGGPTVAVLGPGRALRGVKVA